MADDDVQSAQPEEAMSPVESPPSETVESVPTAPGPSLESQPIPSGQQVSVPPPTLSAPTQRWSDTDRAKASATHQREKEAHLAKIIEYAKKHLRISNNDIEKLLHVSDATASRYAEILVARRALVREGKGRAAAYSIGSSLEG